MSDYIDRQTAINEIARWIGYIDEDMILRIQTGLKKIPSAQPEPIKLHVDALTEEKIKNLKQKIADSPIVFIPSAEVKPVKRGKWILKSEAPITGEKYWECSLCGCGSDSFDTVYFTPYCPNCGAKKEAAPTIIEAEDGATDIKVLGKIEAEEEDHAED